MDISDFIEIGMPEDVGKAAVSQALEGGADRRIDQIERVNVETTALASDRTVMAAARRIDEVDRNGMELEFAGTVVVVDQRRQHMSYQAIIPSPDGLHFPISKTGLVWARSGAVSFHVVHQLAQALILFRVDRL